jgi:hypothetical protein
MKKMTTWVAGVAVMLGVTCTGSMAGIIFQLDHNNLPAVGAVVTAWDSFNEKKDNPVVVDLDGVKWYRNTKIEDSVNSIYQHDGMRHSSGELTTNDTIKINGATIVTAVKPIRHEISDGGWCSIVDFFYDQLCLGIKNNTGQVTVKISGASGANSTWTSTAVIPEEPGVLTLTVGNGANPGFEVFWRGENDAAAVSMGTGHGTTGGQPYTALYPQANGRTFAGYMNLGRNNPDGWPTYNGLIGDTYVYDAQLTGPALLAVQDQVRAAMGFRDAAIPGTVLHVQ